MIKQKQIILSTLFLFVLVLLMGCLDGNSNASAADYADSIMFGGLKRTYLVHIPPFWNKTKNRQSGRIISCIAKTHY